MSDGLGLLIELVVAVLLVLTIAYCIILNRRLKLLRGDEQALRATIGELVTATEIAERAIAGLKNTARECDAGLGERLERGQRMIIELDRKLVACKAVIGHLSQIAVTSRAAEEPKAPVQDPQAIAAAAQAFAERLRNKAQGLAA